MSQLFYRDPGQFDELFGKPPEPYRQPCPGMAMRRTEQGYAVVRLHYTADPELVGDRLAEIMAGFSSEAARRKEMEIDYEALEGQLVFPEFDRTLHIIRPDLIPRRLARYMAIDPHPRTPHAMLWIGIDRWSDWYVYRDHWPSKAYGEEMILTDFEEDHNYTIKEYSEYIAVKEGNALEFRYVGTTDECAIYRQRPRGVVAPEIGCEPEYIIERFMDQAGKGFRASGEDERPESHAERYYRYGIQCNDPYKVREAGFDAIHELLKLRHHDQFGQWPRLHISSRCEELIWEMQNYRFRRQKRLDPEKELNQRGIEARCHMIDLLRYLATAKLDYVKSLES